MIETKFIAQSIRKIEIENYLRKELEKSGFTKLEIEKTPLVTRIIVNVTKPGMVIGKKGQNIKRITKEIEEKFKIENPQLEIKEISVPELDARAMADRMANLLVRGFSWRSVAFRAVRDMMGAGALGVELKLRGKLMGKGARKMRARVFQGYIKKMGNETKKVDFAKVPAYTKGGAIGIKLSIVRPGTIFMDKISVKELLENKPAHFELSKEPEKKEEKKKIKKKEITEEKKSEKIEIKNEVKENSEVK